MTAKTVLFVASLLLCRWPWSVCAQEGIGLTLNNVNYTSNSVVTITDIGTDTAALICTTTRPGCCLSTDGSHWYFPDGSAVQRTGTTYYRTRTISDVGGGAVHLNRNPGATTTGVFRCDIRDASGDLQSLYVGIYTATTGIPGVVDILFQLTSDLHSPRPTFTLTCVSNGGPVTYVNWTRDGIPVPQNRHHLASHTLVNAQVATYHSTLSITGRLPGLYRCEVSSVRPDRTIMDTQDLDIVGTYPPTSISAQPAGPTSIRVSWTAPTSGATVTGYRMYYQAVGDQGSVDDISDNETEYVLLGLQYGLSYNITMLTKSQHLPSHLSSSVTVTLVMVSNVSVKVINATVLMVSWGLVGQSRWTIHHYTIYYSAFSPVLYKVIDESTIKILPNKISEAVVIRELEVGVEHRFQVTASLEIQGEVYEGEKSILTEDSRVVFDEAAFHLQMGPVSPCTTWSTDRAENIRSYIHSGIVKAISYHCNCSFSMDFIRKGLFRCWNSLNELTYRSAIVGTEAHNATELVGFLQEWVNSEPALRVDQFELEVGTRCPVSIPSLKLKGKGKCL